MKFFPVLYRGRCTRYTPESSPSPSPSILPRKEGEERKESGGVEERSDGPTRIWLIQASVIPYVLGYLLQDSSLHEGRVYSNSQWPRAQITQSVYTPSWWKMDVSRSLNSPWWESLELTGLALLLFCRCTRTLTHALCLKPSWIWFAKPSFGMLKFFLCFGMRASGNMNV